MLDIQQAFLAFFAKAVQEYRDIASGHEVEVYWVKKQEQKFRFKVESNGLKLNTFKTIDVKELEHHSRIHEYHNKISPGYTVIYFEYDHNEVTLNGNNRLWIEGVDKLTNAEFFIRRENNNPVLYYKSAHQKGSSQPLEYYVQLP